MIWVICTLWSAGTSEAVFGLCCWTPLALSPPCGIWWYDSLVPVGLDTLFGPTPQPIKYSSVQLTHLKNESIVVVFCYLITKSYPTLCDPMDCNPSGYTHKGREGYELTPNHCFYYLHLVCYPGQTQTLSPPKHGGQMLKVKWKLLSHVRLFVTPWTIQSTEFSRPEYRYGWLFPSPGDLHNPGIEPMSPTLQADSLPAEPPGKPKRICFILFQFMKIYLILIPFDIPKKLSSCFELLQCIYTRGHHK